MKLQRNFVESVGASFKESLEIIQEIINLQKKHFV